MTDFALLPLALLVTSPTNPRKNFNPVKLQELADSIAASGVHQPILVRPLPAQRLLDTAHLKPRPTHEIVAGERRYRASQLAKVDSIPAMIRELTDDQVLEIQIVENIQRDSLTELETAEGYQLLIDRTGIKPEEIGLKVGKSRSSVYGSLKLLDLHPFAKQYLRDETISASAALLIARISDVLLQQKAAIQAASKDDDGHAPSIRTFQSWLRDNVMLDLSKATFPIESISLTAAGSCKTCKTRTGHDPDLFADVKSDMCTHPPCYHLKAQAHKDALAAQVAAIPKASNRNVDEQHDLGLASTLAQDARAQQHEAKSVDRLNSDLKLIKANLDSDVAKAARLASFDYLVEEIKISNDEHASALLSPSLVRAWLLKIVEYDDLDDVALMLHLPAAPTEEQYPDDFLQTCARRVDAAIDADLYRYAATYLLIEDRNTSSQHAQKPATLLIGFAKDWQLDLQPVADAVREAAEAEIKEKITAISKQIKATKPAKTTSTPPPAGAAIGTGEADAKKPKPAALSRKAKTTAEEAKLGIAAAMQSIEAAPLGASLGGAEVAAGGDGALAVGVKVKVLDGKHADKAGVIKTEVGGDMWSVEIGNMFSVYLPTKSLQVIT